MVETINYALQKYDVILMKVRYLTATILVIIFLFINKVSLAATLTEMVEHAVHSSPEILISLNRYKAKKEQVIIQRAGFLPKIDLNASLGKKEKNWKLGGTEQESTDEVVESSFVLEQMLFDGFKTKYGLDSAKSMQISASHSLHAVSEVIALRVAEVYLRVMQYRQLVELSRENLAVHDVIYDQLWQRTGSGFSRSSDLDQIRSRRARASANLVNAINSLSNTRSEFYSVINKKPGALVMPQIDTKLLPLTLENAMSEAGLSNPELKSTGAQIMAMEARRRANQGHKWPDLDLSLDKTWNDTSSDIKTLDGTTDELSVMLNLKYSLYNGGASLARERETIWNEEEARAGRELAHRNVMKDLRLAWDAYVYLAGRMNYLKDHVENSRNVVQAYRQQFRLGKRSLLDLLDTENELFLAQRDFIDVVHEEMLARYRILKGTGKLITTLNVTIPHQLDERLQYPEPPVDTAVKEESQWVPKDLREGPLPTL